MKAAKLEGEKKCCKCGILKPINLENFYSRKLKEGVGFSTYCRQCRRISRVGEYKRGRNTEDIKERKRGYQKMYGQTEIGRAIRLIKAYRSSDKKRGHQFDLSKEWFIENILRKSCYYCGTNNQIGAERVVNSVGHIKSNIIPCCAVCNSVRSDIFTLEEMKIIGATIRKLRESRDVLKISGNVLKSKTYVEYRPVEKVNTTVV